METAADLQRQNLCGSASSAEKSDFEDLDMFASSREQRFRVFASLEFEGQLYMTPRDFLESVTTDEPRHSKKWRSLSRQDLNQLLLDTPPVWKGSSRFFRTLGEKVYNAMSSDPLHSGTWKCLQLSSTDMAIMYCLTGSVHETLQDGNQGKHRVTKRGPALSYPMFTLVTGDLGIVGRWRAVCVTALQRPNSDAVAIRIVVGIAAASLCVTVPLCRSDFGSDVIC
ncbi:unnamed protein product [Ranitomeya imitator]|uniref:Uncharacterized protein n=1 Tax=Ranitomeya imitator TaxID=111125 RepID=A0ABN9LUS0_9NEOB|nr:unnamed protein product [Ranitomeya imitator]